MSQVYCWMLVRSCPGTTPTYYLQARNKSLVGRYGVVSILMAVARVVDGVFNGLAWPS